MLDFHALADRSDQRAYGCRACLGLPWLIAPTNKFMGVGLPDPGRGSSLIDAAARRRTALDSWIPGQESVRPPFEMVNTVFPTMSAPAVPVTPPAGPLTTVTWPPMGKASLRDVKVIQSPAALTVTEKVRIG